ncbi:MAG: FAD-dependent oxidoreductase [Acidobacteriota bacterium]|nr:FAD-dependent oxidoreductase [Acidobacteriota bacterium]
MKIAVVGTGISGLTAAYLLHPEHEITVFEAQDRIGGHTITSEIASNGGTLAVDAGFIVHNPANYPNFIELLSRLGVETQPTSMSFSVRCDRTGLEYAGTNLNSLFAQRSNLFRPGFYGLLREILRFNKAAAEAAGNGLSGTLGDFLGTHQLSDRLAEHYLIPMTAAIWSTEPGKILDTPAKFILRFLDNHDLLSTRGFEWRVIKGGSQRYVDKLTAPFRDRIRLSSPVRRLDRMPDGVAVSTDAGTERFDEVVVAAHADQALAMLARPSRAEREVLGATRYQSNPAILHTDASVLPRKKAAWASWNYRAPREPGTPVAVTYNMTRLQSLATDAAYCVSLNMRADIAEERKLESFDFEHPLFSEEAVAAQQRHHEISGVDRIHYCGAYWRHGFHEDGVVSALEVTRRFGVSL